VAAKVRRKDVPAVGEQLQKRLAVLPASGAAMQHDQRRTVCRTFGVVQTQPANFGNGFVEVHHGTLPPSV
jgi:hypothetical protein